MQWINYPVKQYKINKKIIDGKVKKVYNENVRKEKRLDIVTGLPTSGKSSILILQISKKYNSRIVDNDLAKKLIPEFDNDKI